MISLVTSWFLYVVIYPLWFLGMNFRMWVCLYIMNELSRSKWNFKNVQKSWWCFKERLGHLAPKNSEGAVGRLFVCYAVVESDM